MQRPTIVAVPAAPSLGGNLILRCETSASSELIYWEKDYAPLLRTGQLLQLTVRRDSYDSAASLLRSTPNVAYYI